MKVNKVIQELKRISDENGGMLQPAVVVQEARSPRSPLHSRFTWDDSEAAQAYRLWQARQLISVSVEVIAGSKTETDVFVSLPQDRERDGGGYRLMVDVLSQTQLRKKMLQQALTELNHFQKKYQDLKELSAVFAAAKKIRRKAA